MYLRPLCCKMVTRIRKEVVIEVPPKTKIEGKGETP